MEENIFHKIGDAYEEFKEEHPVTVKVIKIGIVAVAGAFVYSLGKKAGHEVYVDRPYTPEEMADQMAKSKAIEYENEYDANRSDISEDVFCNIADWIQGELFDESNDEALFSKDYEVKFARGGDYKDYKDGLYSINKNLKIYVSDAETANPDPFKAQEANDEQNEG